MLIILLAVLVSVLGIFIYMGQRPPNLRRESQN